MSSGILTKPWPYLALILAHIIWGANFAVAKVTLQEFPPSTLAFFRFALASLLLAPFFLAETKKVKIKSADLPKLVLVGILMVTLNITFFFAGIEKTTVINASVLTLIIPMLSVILSWWFLKEHIFIVNLIGIILGLIGAIIIVGFPEVTNQTSLVGNILIVLAAISWVIGALISRKLLKSYSSLEVTAIIFMVGTITFFIPAAIEYIKNPAWVENITSLGILGLVYMTLLSSVSAYFLFEWGLSRTSVMTADLFQYIEPFVATLVAILVLGEFISMPFLIGAVLIIIGVYMGTFAKQIHHRIRLHRH
jgi:drug/metabolite transporter (DMT)-like permease